MTITATLDHRTGLTVGGGPASRYHRVGRCDDDPARAVAPNYPARQLGALLVAMIVVMSGAWLVGQAVDSVSAQPVSAAESGASVDVASAPAAAVSHVARAGDSLWSIADAYRGDVDRERYVDALVALNGGTTVYVGQAVRLP